MVYNGVDSKTRISVTIEKDLKAKLEELAKKDGRSLNNYIISALNSHVNSLNSKE